MKRKEGFVVRRYNLLSFYTRSLDMLEVLQFVFSSFWIWLGCVILLSVPFWGVGKWFKIALKAKKKKTTHEDPL